MSSSLRASDDSHRIGADLLSNPAPVKKQLGHLVGRALVPFFADEAGAEENVDHALCSSEHRDFGVGGDASQVRAFVDGYFVDSGKLGDQQQNTHAATSKPLAAHTRTKQPAQQPQAASPAAQPAAATKQKPARTGSAQPAAAAATSAAAVPASTGGKKSKGKSASGSSSASAVPARLYAGAAFQNSPSPLQVPLPKFLTSAAAASSHASDAPVAAVPASPNSSRAKSAHAKHAHPHADPHASQSLMNLLFKANGTNAGGASLLGPAPQSTQPLLKTASQERARVAAEQHAHAHGPPLHGPPGHAALHAAPSSSHLHHHGLSHAPVSSAHPASPNTTAAAAAYTHAFSTLTPGPHPIPALPSYPAHTHAYQHYSAAPAPYYSAAAYAHAQPAGMHAHHAPPSGAVPVPQPSAVYSRYDRPQAHTQAAYMHGGAGAYAATPHFAAQHAGYHPHATYSAAGTHYPGRPH